MIILAAIAVLGITGNLGTAVDKNITSVFSKGFVSGYQTMDALASVIFGVVIVKGLEGKGITDEKEQRYFLSGSGLIAAIGLGLIYFSLMYLGAKVSGVDISSPTRAALYLAEITLGSAGKIAFGVCVATACLTTSVGLVAISSDWFSRLTPISYKAWAIIICVFSGVVAIEGVDFIVKLSVPVLCILYPVTIILILLNIFGINHVLVYRLATYTTLVAITLEVGASTFGITSISEMLLNIPLAKDGFVWVLPCVISMVIGSVVAPIRKKAKLRAKAEKNR